MGDGGDQDLRLPRAHDLARQSLAAEVRGDAVAGIGKFGRCLCLVQSTHHPGGPPMRVAAVVVVRLCTWCDMARDSEG
jgi:hypothetical protein